MMAEAPPAVPLGLTPSQVPSAGRGPRRRRGGRGKGGGGRGCGDGDGGNDQPSGRAPNAVGGESQQQPQGGQASASANTDGDGAKRASSKRRPRRRGRRGSGGPAMDDAVGDGSNAPADGSAEAAAGGESAGPSAAAESSKPQTKQQKKQQQKKEPQQKEQQKPQAAKKKRNRTRNRRKAKAPRPWLEHIPPGAVDPISLDPLADLPYPPFAVCVEPPYVPILPGMWPPSPPTILAPGEDAGKAMEAEAASKTDGGNEKDREMEILQQQWGQGLTVLSKTEDEQKTDMNDSAPSAALSSNTIQGRHLNLFDGRVLAYYLVSTLSFIDPYNRRNLTRPEMEALDAYLAHHELGNAGVVEAYDDKGVSVSRASDAAHTATGRAEILQQEARAILGSFFGGAGGRGGGGAQPPRQQQHRERRNVRRVRSMESLSEGQQEQGEATNAFQRMYAADERNRRNAPQQPYAEPGPQDTGIYGGDDGGLLLIDDDINPGLRGGMHTTNSASVPGPGNRVGTGTLYSARHIAEQHSQAAQVREGAFPSLSSTAASSSAAPPVASRDPTKPLPVGPAPKSLSKISKLVKKTDPKQVERQRKAREEAQRRAEMSKLSFFDPEAGPAMANGTNSLPTAPAANQPPSDAMLERNRNLAMALGVAPSTVRNVPALTGWARPVAATAAKDEFGNELNAAQYPDALLSEAKERMTELLKLERQWKKFLADDRAASCSLKAMDRPLRKFVHEYSDFWRMHTESFDPEGRRYIQCSKLADTSAPYPLLSEAARRWRGPAAGPSVASVDVMSLPTGPSLKPAPASSTTATTTSDGWRTEQRVPLKLAPRTAAVDGFVKPPPVPPPASTSGMTRSTSTPLLSMTGERPPPPRFADLHDKERPRLQLAPRSIPTWDALEGRSITQEEWNAMPPEDQERVLKEIEEEEERRRLQYEREKEKEEARIQRLENKAKKQEELQVKKKAILESAFASDDDSDASSGSDWFEGDLEFDGSDDEGM